MTAEWQSTRLHPVRMQLRHRRPGRGPHGSPRIRGDKAHPASQGYTCNKALRLDHYQNSRDRLTSPLRRRPDGSYEEIDWDTAIAEIAEGFKRIRDSYGGDKIFYYGGGGQGNHLGGAYSGAFLKALGSRYRSNALAQEKTGEAWVDAHLYGGHTRGEFEHAEVVGVRRQEPVDVAELSASARGAQRDRQGSGPLDDRDRSGGHRHRQDGRLPPAGAARHRRVVPGRAGRRPRAGKPLRRSVSRRARHGADAVRDVLREVPVADYAQRCGVDEELIRAAARRIGTRRQRVGVRGPRHPAGTQQHAVLLPEQAAVDPHRQLRQTRWPAPAFVVRAAVRPRVVRPHAGHRRADHRRAGARQRRARGDPDRPSRPVPGDDRRKQQSRALARRLGRAAARRSSRWNCWSSSTSR